MRWCVPVLVLVSVGAVACWQPNPLYMDSSAELTGTGAGTMSAGGEASGASTSGSQGESEATSAGASSGSGTTADTGVACTPGESEACYSGPMGSAGVGVCVGGMRTCGREGSFGPCVGEVVPQPELCGDGLDNECDGVDVDRCEPPLAECPDRPGLVACYPFPPQAPALVDGSGHKRHGTLNGVMDSVGVDGFGNAGAFATGYAAVGEDQAFNTPAFTVALLFRAMGPGVLIDKNGHYAMTIGPDGTLTCIFAKQDQTLVTMDGPGALGSWYFAACAHDGNMPSIYVKSQGMAPGYANIGGPTGPLTMGGGSGFILGGDSPDPMGVFINGQIDQVLLFDKALSDADLCGADPFCP